ACPEPGCEMAAEVVSRWGWPSTDGPIEHVKAVFLHAPARTLPTAWPVGPARRRRAGLTGPPARGCAVPPAGWATVVCAHGRAGKRRPRPLARAAGRLGDPRGDPGRGARVALGVPGGTVPLPGRAGRVAARDPLEPGGGPLPPCRRDGPGRRRRRGGGPPPPAPAAPPGCGG